MFVVLSEWHGLVAVQPFKEIFVGLDQSDLVNRDLNGPQFIDHFIGQVVVFRNFRI